MAQRIKGQEVVTIVTRGDQTEATLSAIQNLNLTLVSEIKDVGYLGEVHDRIDDMYKSAKGDFEFNTDTPDWIDLVTAIIQRQQRIQPDLVFNVTAVFSYPNGQTRAGTLADVKFGEIPINIASRGDYVKKKFSFQCETIDWFDPST